MFHRMMKFNILHGMKQEQDSLLEKEGSMKMDQNLTVSYEEQKAQWRKEKNSSRRKCGIFKTCAGKPHLRTDLYSLYLQNMTGAAVLLWVVATIGYICYIVKNGKGKKSF